ncbi:mfsd6b, partial [Symbiodinium natans]
MRPLLGGGLASLAPQELETVLKGRLHQAVSIAQMTDLPNRWGRVKDLSEDVLQFDFNNAHARWLRGLSLKSQGRIKEAEEECRRAVECARSQGKDAEAHQWESEIKSTFSDGSAQSSRKSPETPAAASGASGPAEGEADPAEKKVSSSSLQKGFLNRSSRKTEAMGQGKDVESKTARTPKTPKASEREVELEQELESLRRSYQNQEAELKKQTMSSEAKKAEEQRFRDGAEVILRELENCIGAISTSESPSSSPTTKTEALQQATERMQAGKAWAQNEQQRYVEFSTEVLTLQEMSAKEFREQEESASKQSKELRELAKRFSDLLRSAKHLDGYIREQSSGRETAVADLQYLAQQVADFHSLSWTSKLAAMADDG